MKSIEDSRIKIAYLIQAYADSYAFKNLVETLLKMNNCEIFVHLDSKSDIKKFFIDDQRVHFINNREYVSWAGYAQGKLIFNLIEAALEYDKKFDYYCFLSESDFPVLYGDELIERIKNSRTVLMDCSINQPQKIERFWFYDFNISSPKINKIVSKIVNAFFGLLYNFRILRKSKYVNIDGNSCHVFTSGPFWCLNYEILKYINDIFSRNKEFQNYFKHSFASCELMVATILGNSPYSNSCDFVDEYINLNHLSDICYFCYTGPRVNVLNEGNYDEIVKSGKPFIRKVKKQYSDELIKLIERNWSNKV